MASPTVSIALCTYCGERFLQAQLDSFLAQTRLPDEIVAVDDASTDGTWAMLEAFAARSSVPVRLYRNEKNLGYVRNFERALSLTQGDILFLSDQDDVWMPDKLATMMLPFEARTDITLVHSDAELVDAAGMPMRVRLFDALELSPMERQWVDTGHAFNALLRRNLVTGAACAIRREVFEEAVPCPPGVVHDEWLALVASLLGSIVRIDVPLIAYRQHGKNQIGIRRRSWLERLRPSHSREELRAILLNRYRTILGLLRDRDFADAGALERVHAQLKHIAFRATLPIARSRRLGPVWREWRTGRYTECSRGLRSVFRDLVGKVHPMPIEELREFEALTAEARRRFAA